MSSPEQDRFQNTHFSDLEIEQFKNIPKSQRVDGFLQSLINSKNSRLNEVQKQDLLRFSFVVLKVEDIKKDFNKPNPPRLMGYPGLGETIFNPNGQLFFVSSRSTDSFSPSEAFSMVVHIADHIYEKRMDKKSKKIAREMVDFIQTIMK